MLYKEIVELLKDIFLEKSISFDFGTLQDYVDHNKTFPFSFIEPAQILYDIKSVSYSFRLHLLDQVEKDGSNEIDIISEMEYLSRWFMIRLTDAGKENSFEINFSACKSEVVLYVQDEGLAGFILDFTIYSQNSNNEINGC